MKFQPLPGLSIAALIGLLILIGLGTWQLQRRAEKHELLQQIESRQALPPAPIEVLISVGDYAAFRAATATGTFLHASEAFVWEARTDKGPTQPGYRVVTPFRLLSDDIILVDRGWIPKSSRDPARRKEGQPHGQVEIEGSLRRTAQAARFTPTPNVARREFYARDSAAIARVLGIVPRTPLLLEATGRVPGGPEPLPTAVNIPDNHLNYALTWYSLAVVLTVIYLRVHQIRGRLSFRP